MITEKLGGRKFLLAMIAVVVGAAIELTTARGLTTNMAGLLVGVIGMFGAANALVTRDALKMEAATSNSEGDSSSAPPIDTDDIVSKIVAEMNGANNETAKTLANIGMGVANGNKLLKVAIFGNSGEEGKE